MFPLTPSRDYVTIARNYPSIGVLALTMFSGFFNKEIMDLVNYYTNEFIKEKIKQDEIKDF